LEEVENICIWKRQRYRKFPVRLGISSRGVGVPNNLVVIGVDRQLEWNRYTHFSDLRVCKFDAESGAFVECGEEVRRLAARAIGGPHRSLEPERDACWFDKAKISG
jgi:hypothetical protein